MSEQNVVGRYDDILQAEEAIRSLDQSGFPIKQVSVNVQNLESKKKVDGFVTVKGVKNGKDSGSCYARDR